MRFDISIISILATSFTFVSKVFAEVDPNFHIYLAFGQSNMEGQGPIEEQDLIPEERFKMISTTEGCKGHHLGEWYDAVPPLASCIGRLGPVDYFGRTLVKSYQKKLRLVLLSLLLVVIFNSSNKTPTKITLFQIGCNQLLITMTVIHTDV